MTAKCPYCYQTIEINHDDLYGLDEDKLHEQECTNCKKVFVYNTIILLSYTTYQADCLNGGNHDYYKIKAPTPNYPALRCKQCGYEELAEQATAQKRLDTLTNSLVNDIINSSNEQILEEAKELFEDPQQEIDRLKKIINSALPQI